MALNKVFLIGNLGADPEMRYSQGGMAIARVRLATNEQWTDKSGQKQERTEWHSVVAFGKQAEYVGEYCKKGRQIFVEGSLQTRQWDDKDGNKRYTTEVKAFRVQGLGGPGGGGGGGTRSAGASEPPMPEGAPEGPPPDEEVPF